MGADFTFSVDGDDSGLLQSLRRAESMESLDALDTVLVELDCAGDASLEALLKRLAPGAAFEISAGGRKLSGDVVRVTARMGPLGQRRVLLVGLELLHRLRHQRVSALLELAKDKIAERLIKAATARPKATAVSATAGEELLIDDPALFTLKQLADERNYALRAEGKVLHFAPRGVAAGKAGALDWESEVRSAELIQDISELLTSVKVTGLDYRKPDTAIGYETLATDLRKISGPTTGVSLRKKALGELAVVRAAGPTCTTASDAKERAKAELQRRAETFLRASYKASGRPDLHPGQSLTVSDAPWPFGGPFLVRAVHHVLYPPQLSESRVEVFSDGLPKG